MNDLSRRREEWTNAVNSRDIDSYADIVTEDVVWIPPAGDAIVGREAFRAWLQPFFSAYDYSYSVSNTRLQPAGTWIAESSDFESMMTPVGGGNSMSHGGRYLVIWRRDAEHVWRIDRYVDLATLITG